MAERNDYPGMDSGTGDSQRPRSEPEAVVNPSTGSETADAMVEALWGSVESRWNEAKAHDAFLQACVDRGLLGEAARRYRLQREVAGRGELANKRLELVAVLAMQQLQAHRTEGPKPAPRWVTWVAAGLCLAAVGLLAYAMLAW